MQMPTKHVHKMDLLHAEVKFKHVDRLSADGARFDVWVDEPEDDREWRVDLLEDNVQVVASYRDGALANVDEPEWLDEWAARLRRQR